MTILNWELKPEHVLLLTDTLSLDPADRRALTFTTKIFPAPHIGAVIAGTGIGPVITQFYLRAIGMVVRDVSHLAEFAQDTLQEIWKEGDALGMLPEGTTTTIYTFGLSEEEGEFKAYAYRSTAQFQPEQLPHGLVMKPQTTMQDLEAVDSLEAFVALTRKQQTQDRESPREKRIGIGGDLWMYLLEKSQAGALAMRIERLERMQHYDLDREVILAKLPQNANHPRTRSILARDP